MADKTVRIVIVGDSASAERAARAVNAAFSDTDSKVASFANRLKSAGAGMATVGRNLSTYVTLPLIGIGVQAIRTVADFQTTMNTMKAVAGVPGPELRKLKDLAIELGAKTAFSANQAAAGMLELAKAGVKTKDIMGGALKNTLDLATAGGMELAQAATTAANAMNVFGLSGKQSQQAVDALAGAANASSADVADLALALSQGGNAANSAGLSIQETTAALAAFADAGIKGSDAGTSLKTFLLNLVPTSIKAKEEMNRLGLSFVDSAGNIKGLTSIAEELRTKLGGLTQAQQQAALKTLFGSDAYRAARIVMDEGSKGLEKYIDATSKAGTASEVAAGKMKGLPGALEKFKGALDTVLLTVGEALAPTVRKAADVLTELGDRFVSMPKPMQETIVMFAAIAAAVGPVLFVLGHLTKGVGHLVDGLRSLATPAGQARLALAGLAIAVIGFASSFGNAAQSAESMFQALSAGGPAAADFHNNLTQIVAASDNFTTKVSDAFKAVFTGAPTATQKFNALREEIEATRVAASNMEGTTQTLAIAQADFAEASLNAADALARYGEGSEEARSAAEALERAEHNLTAAQKLSEVAAIELAIATESLIETRDRLAGVTDDVRTAELNLSDAKQTLREAQRNLNELVESGITSGRKYKEAQEAVERAQIAVREANRHLNDSYRSLEDNLEAAINKGRNAKDAFLKLAESYGLNRDLMKDLIRDLPEGSRRLDDIGRVAGFTDRQMRILHLGLESIQEGARKGTEGAKREVSKLPGIVGAVAGPVQGQAYSIGTAIVMGATAGLNSMVDGFVGAAQNMAVQAISAAKGALDARSPSRVFIQIGKDVAEGFALGIEEHAPRVSGAMNKVLEMVTQAADKMRAKIREFTSSIKGGFSGIGSITGSLGNLDQVSQGDIQQFLNESFQDAHGLSRGLKRLEDMGLNRGTLTELAEGGAASLPLIDALVAGGKQLIGQVNENQRLIDEVAGKTANSLKRDEFDLKQLAIWGEMHNALKEMLKKLDRVGNSTNIQVDAKSVDKFTADDVLRLLRWIERQG